MRGVVTLISMMAALAGCRSKSTSHGSTVVSTVSGGSGGTAAGGSDNASVGGAAGQAGDAASSGASASSGGASGAPGSDGSGGVEPSGAGGVAGNGGGAGGSGNMGGSSGAGAAGGTGGSGGSDGTSVEVLWSDDFESGLGDWNVEGGVWSIGTPSYGPAPLSGDRVAGTALDGTYPDNADARLVSPSFSVPESGDVRLRYWFWYDMEHQFDTLELQLRVDGEWQAEPIERLTGDGRSWSQRILELDAFAGQTLQVGFRLVSDDGVGLAGWFIDDISLEVGLWRAQPDQDFEAGFGEWSVEGGVWSVGEPSYAEGPEPASGSGVAGTVLGSWYPTNADARLVSPPFVVPAAEQNPRLRYAYWYDLEPDFDWGQLELRIGGVWQEVAGERVSGSSGAWSQRIVELDSHAGETLQVGFRFTSDEAVVLAGWYIDDVALLTD